MNMARKEVFDQLHQEGILSEKSYTKCLQHESAGIFSVHWELKTLLYLGVILLSGGLGILVYRNIDSIGHQAILLFLVSLCAGCFFYCIKTGKGFLRYKTESPHTFFDYALLLACLCFITIIGYVQYQFHFFGERYGLATFVPMVVLFISAYYFDQLAVLSLAITNLGAWLGIAVTPLRLLRVNDFDSNTIIFTGIFLGLALMIAAFISVKNNFKKHFEFTYSNFGMHLLFVSSLSGMFNYESIYLLWLMLIAGISYFFYRRALSKKSFYIILVTVLYSYVAMAYVVIRFIDRFIGNTTQALYAGFLYFIISAVVFVIFLVRMNKKLKTNDSL